MSSVRNRLGLLFAFSVLVACDLVLGLGGLGDRPADDASAPSCSDVDALGQSVCGPVKNEHCCATLRVEGGTFHRSNDKTVPATVSAFRLDRFVVTVGRFRRFVDALIEGWRPEDGAGKHSHLHNGKGLASAGEFEHGWRSTWTSAMPSTKTDWLEVLSCSSDRATWSSKPEDKEAYPINCISWLEAYAFCIWDGGFLPSEAEWNYAAAGGSEQRYYPWSNPPSDTAIDCTFANYNVCEKGVSVIGLFPQGDGKWGHADLAGNLWEWALDYYGVYESPCVDCAYLTTASERTLRGGSFLVPATSLATPFRNSSAETARSGNIGVRCARSP